MASICKCKICQKEPHQIDEYNNLAEEIGCTAEQAVISEEGTYNPKSKLFYCTNCYIKIGMPLGKA